MIVVGLTGSIGTGKTTVSGILKKKGISVISSDDIVNELYKDKAVNKVGKFFSESIRNGRVDKNLLLEKLKESPEKLEIIEKIIHPMVRIREREVLRDFFRRGEKIVFFDTPLLFEKKKEFFFDKVIVVTCSFETQRKRVLSRKNYTEESFQFILSKQISEKEKISRADYVISTEGSLDETEKKVSKMLTYVRKNTNSSNSNAQNHI
ncbi:dephospho-CoA kinase [Candidatus Liberibacter sp.]|uniref:dephospho-CoA kinase n=1 Tax=Candidatus Liberibacter sp. TaxID=34022 RepID=UPI0015F5828E|nr:dephospho-CoA kinase [Candidatus Liberibacter sp.]MBA5723971.1 dephospho-CoA kinase [Candidatus Liberibacter sp.]